MGFRFPVASVGWLLFAIASCGGTPRNFGSGEGAGGAAGDGGTANDAGESQTSGGSGSDAGADPGPNPSGGAAGLGTGEGGRDNSGAGGAEPNGGAVGGGDAADAGAGGTGVDPGPLTWCDGRTPTSGVAALDFQCLDFDDGLPSTAVWSQDLAGGSLALTQLVASSSPNSLGLAADSEERARISWSRVGPSKVLAVTVAADFNPVTFPAAPPPWPGSAEVLCVELGGGTACLHYKWGASGQDYFVRVVPSLVMMPKDCAMSASPGGGDWTRVELSALSTGQVLLKLNNVNVLTSCSNQFSTATSAKVTVGLNASDTSNGWTVRVDNVEASLAR